MDDVSFTETSAPGHATGGWEGRRAGLGRGELVRGLEWCLQSVTFPLILPLVYFLRRGYQVFQENENLIGTKWTYFPLLHGLLIRLTRSEKFSTFMVVKVPL